MKFNSTGENLEHMAITHAEKFIIPYMKVKGKEQDRIDWTM